ncbi:protein adenylyltransferase SelO, mitochondrial-like [Amphiura filiformis]|uniref:protein adenylyltransferase SelO, mitochondrial-like n=1 Tax=Amphiura filiformis TaxID=82378 RepID=UPI003B214A75
MFCDHAIDISHVMNRAIHIASLHISCGGKVQFRSRSICKLISSSSSSSQVSSNSASQVGHGPNNLQNKTGPVQIMLHRMTKNKLRPKKMASLESLNFDNLVLRSLPIDSVEEIQPRQVKGACFSKMKLSPVANPDTVAVSSSALRLLDLDEEQWQRAEFAEYFGGNKLLPGSQLAAHCYCGHQFGYFAGQLGDGAAMYLGEVVNKAGKRWEIQLKGSGLTPYSRQADGRKVLRSSIREFLCSEAMHHLGISTTRAGCCITSDTKVIRDVFYSGNPIREKATVILRIAPTFIRFGSFEIFKPLDPMSGRQGPSVGRKDILDKMLDYTIKTFYPKVYEDHPEDTGARNLAFYKEVMRLTAMLVAEWQCVGFCHGVLNTDNMSIAGATIDYGPFGFMDAYNPDHICNTSDDGGRYSYKKQPEICRWNLGKLAEAISMSLPEQEAKAELPLYDECYQRHYMEKMRKKLGLLRVAEDDDKALIESFLDTMDQTKADFTNCFRCLSQLLLPGTPGCDDAKEKILEYLVSQSCTAEELKKACKPQMDPREMQMMMMLMQVNPDLLSQLAGGHQRLLRELQKMEQAEELKDLTDAKKQETDRGKWSAWLDSYNARLTKEVTTDANFEEHNQERSKVMNANNPKFVLRNYIAQNAINAAEKGDYSEVQRVLKMLETPYSDTNDLESLAAKPSEDEGASTSTADEDSGATAGAGPSSASNQQQTSTAVKSCTGLSYDSKPPEWAANLQVT